MKNLEWKFKHPEVTEEVIQDTENKLSLKLPADYVTFITKHSGARPTARLIDLRNGREVVMDRVLPIESDSEQSVEGYAKSLKSVFDQHLIPFGEDPFGNLFCFRYEDNEYSDIVFWNHEKKTTLSICDSFSEFLSLLHSDEVSSEEDNSVT